MLWLNYRQTGELCLCPCPLWPRTATSPVTAGQHGRLGHSVEPVWLSTGVPMSPEVLAAAALWATLAFPQSIR